MNNKVNIIECPRDAMQGIKKFIPTSLKVEYLNSLLKVGFNTLDCGSFVSPQSIPQMADTFAVIPQLDLKDTDTKLSVIIANKRGAEQACEFDEITYIGYPFSVSETFQQRNTNCSIEESLQRVEEIIQKYYNKGMIFQNPKAEDQWAYWERVPDLVPKDKSLVQKDHEKRLSDKLPPKNP